MNKLNQATADGEASTLNELDESFRYRQFLGSYIQKQGRMSREEYNEFKDLREVFVRRVLQETDILFVKCNTAGSKAIVDGFQASVIVVDEAGQA